MSESKQETSNPTAVTAIVAGVLAVVALFIMYWFPVPSALLGIVAIVLGIMGRRRAIQGAGGRDMAVAAIVLGVMAILGNALAQKVSFDTDKFGRECATNYGPDCPDWLKPN